MIPDSVDDIVINTGNLINYKEFKKKATQSPSEEVFESVSNTFNSWFSTFHSEAVKDLCSVSCLNESQITKVDKEERINLKVTVKVFLESLSTKDLKSCVSLVMNALNIMTIDSLILSLPPLSQEEKFGHIKSLWTELEKLVEESKVLTIGVSDLDTSELSNLYDWTQVKPSVNQVNLESCCVMPPEMTAFAKDNDIQLLTHNDPKVLLSKEMLTDVLKSAVPAPERWKIKWTLRYSVVVKSRGIIQNKGYILCCSRHN